MNNQKLIGIVTVLYNSDDVLPDFYESLACQKDVQFILYVIDNSKISSGTVISESLAEKYGIASKHVFNNNNYGVAKGNNQGIALALEDGCQYILLANNDTCFLNEYTIKELVEPLSQSGFDLTTPKIKYYDTKKIWSTTGYISEWKGIAVHIGVDAEDLGQFDQAAEIDYAPTCFMAFRSSILKNSTPMDEKYFVYYDDSDFILNIRKKGFRLWYIPKSEVLHKVSSSTGGGETDFSIYYLNRNRVYFILKNYRSLKRVVALTYTMSTRPFRYRAKIGFVCKAMMDGFKLYSA